MDPYFFAVFIYVVVPRKVREFHERLERVEVAQTEAWFVLYRVVVVSKCLDVPRKLVKLL